MKTLGRDDYRDLRSERNRLRMQVRNLRVENKKLRKRTVLLPLYTMDTVHKVAQR